MNDSFDDEELIDKCLAGDRLGQNLLYKKFYSYSMSICRRYISDSDEVTWVMSNGFLKIFENLKKFDRNRPIKPWVKTIMVNTCLTYLTSNKKYKFHDDLSDVQIESDSPSPEGKMLYDDLLKQIKLLPPQYRAVLNLYIIDGYGHTEIAKMLNISVGTSKSNLHKAKEKLKKEVKRNLGVIQYEQY